MMINSLRFHSKYQNSFKFTKPQTSKPHNYLYAWSVHFSHLYDLFGQLKYLFLKGSQPQCTFSFAPVPSPGYYELLI